MIFRFGRKQDEPTPYREVPEPQPKIYEVEIESIDQGHKRIVVLREKGEHFTYTLTNDMFPGYPPSVDLVKIRLR